MQLSIETIIFKKNLERMKIILVEDNESLNRLVSFSLEKAGHEVHGFMMASELIENYQSLKPDLLLLDFSLPDMNGRELVEVLQEMKYDAPFVIVTGHSDIKLAVELMKMGALDFVVKDESFQEVLPAVVERVNKHIIIQKDNEKYQKQLVESEKLYRNTVNQIPDPILYYYKGEPFYINQAFERILGYDMESLRAEKWKRLKAKTHFKKIDIWFENASENEVYPVFEMQLKTSQGKLIYVLVKAVKTKFNDKDANMILFSDITEKRQFEARLMKSIIDTEEKERIRFARDLHDELGPILSGIKLYVDLQKRNNPNPQNDDELCQKITDLIDSAVSISRNLSGDLIPGVLLDFGVKKAIAGFVEQMSHPVSTEINFESNLDIRLEQNVEITLFRVVKELVNNSLKHSECNSIDVQLLYSENGIVRLFYEDDGKGFDFDDTLQNAKRTGLGLSNITNRLNMIQATCNIETSPGNGFALSASIDTQNG